MARGAAQANSPGEHKAWASPEKRLAGLAGVASRRESTGTAATPRNLIAEAERLAFDRSAPVSERRTGARPPRAETPGR